jgi:hypothetical protein
MVNEIIRRAEICLQLASLEPAPGIDTGRTVTGAANGVVERMFYNRDRRIAPKAKVNGRWYYVTALTAVESEADRNERITASATAKLGMWDEVMVGDGRTFGQYFESKVK